MKSSNDASWDGTSDLLICSTAFQNVQQYFFVFVMALNIKVLALWEVTWSLLVTACQILRCHVAERCHLTISSDTQKLEDPLYIKMPLTDKL